MTTLTTRRQQMARERAVRVLGRYISLLSHKAGLSYEINDDTAIACLVDDIIEAATPPKPGETAHVEELQGWGDKREKV